MKRSARRWRHSNKLWGLNYAAHPGTYGDTTLRVDWIPEQANLGLTICPGRKDRGRNLDVDMAVLPPDTVLVCLIPEAQLKTLGLTRRKLTAAAKRAGHTIEFFPIPDFDVPTDRAAAVKFIRHLADDLVWPGDKNVVVFCKGGLGRSGMVAACILCENGADPDEAISIVRAARSKMAVETMGQENFVRWYAASAPQPITRKAHTLITDDEWAEASLRRVIDDEPWP